MTNDELKTAFPYGATVIPYDETGRVRSYLAALGPNEGDDATFALWDSNEHNTLFELDSLVLVEDGFDVKNLDGVRFHLRPLPVDKELKLDA